MLTRSRGSDGVNVVAMIVGISSVLVLCKITIPAFDLLPLFTGKIVTLEGRYDTSGEPDRLSEGNRLANASSPCPQGVRWRRRSPDDR
jgi:hypothetical protein